MIDPTNPLNPQCVWATHHLHTKQRPPASLSSALEEVEGGEEEGRSRWAILPVGSSSSGHYQSLNLIPKSSFIVQKRHNAWNGLRRHRTDEASFPLRVTVTATESNWVLLLKYWLHLNCNFKLKENRFYLYESTLYNLNSLTVVPHIKTTNFYFNTLTLNILNTR